MTLLRGSAILVAACAGVRAGTGRDGVAHETTSMVFNSLEFAVFFLAVFALYHALRHRAQNLLLLVASYVFYGAWDWRFLGLIALSTVVDYAVGLQLAATDDVARRKRWLLVSLVTNLGILGAFKYFGFFADSLAGLAALGGLDLPRVTTEIVLPVGISFYTFQTLSYTIDIYRKRLQPTRGFLDFALFVAFFPQLVAGPIERASRLLPQVLSPRKPTSAGFGSGCWLILRGLFKKVVLADNLAPLADRVFESGADVTGLETLLGVYAFAWQIYGDFSGYSDMARGLARLLGFELMLNFDLPYLATSPSDFWRRWHISLSTWLRDYLYIPLGGNRGGRAFVVRNLMLTMLLGGLWHGAAWTFVAWGLYQGLLLVAHRSAEPALTRLAPTGPIGARLWWGLRVVVTFHLACVGWLIFRAESFADLGRRVGTLVGSVTASIPEPGLALEWLPVLAVLILPVLLFQVVQAARRDPEVLVSAPLLVRTLVYVVVFEAIVLLGEDFGAPFIYFQF